MTRAAIVLALWFAATTVHADPITVGVFAPSAPFPSTAARVELANKLAEQLAKALGGSGSGRVYVRASDYSAAVKRGDVAIGLVDAAFLATSNPSYTVIGAAVRGGETSHGWLLLARGGDKLGQLKAKRVLVPSLGGRESELLLDVLLGGEVPGDFFGKIEPAPDSTSAVAALGLGKTDAAAVPSGLELPAGVTVVLKLPALPGALLVAYGTLTPERRDQLIAAAAEFHADGTITGFRAGDPEDIRAVARRLSPPVKRGPLAVPAVRLVVSDLSVLFGDRHFAIERTPATAFAIAPPSR